MCYFIFPSVRTVTVTANKPRLYVIQNTIPESSIAGTHENSRNKFHCIIWILSIYEQQLQPAFIFQQLKEQKRMRKYAPFCPMNPIAEMALLWSKVPRLRPFVLLIKSSSEIKTGGATLTGWDRSTGTETGATATLFITNLTRTGLGLNLGAKTKLNLHLKKAAVRPSQRTHCASITNTKRLMFGKWRLFNLAIVGHI